MADEKTAAENGAETEPIVEVHFAHNLATGRTDVQTSTSRFDLICAAVGSGLATILLQSKSAGEQSQIVRPRGPIPPARLQ